MSKFGICITEYYDIYHVNCTGKIILYDVIIYMFVPMSYALFHLFDFLGGAKFRTWIQALFGAQKGNKICEENIWKQTYSTVDGKIPSSQLI